MWPTIDSPAGVKPEEVPIVAEVKSAEWRFYSGSWQKRWSESDHQPDGVELTLTMENGETWRWVFTTPGDMPQPQIAAKAEGEKPEAAPSAPAPEQAAAPATGGQP